MEGQQCLSIMCGRPNWILAALLNNVKMAAIFQFQLGESKMLLHSACKAFYLYYLSSLFSLSFFQAASAGSLSSKSFHLTGFLSRSRREGKMMSLHGLCLVCALQTILCYFTYVFFLTCKFPTSSWSNAICRKQLVFYNIGI